MTAPGATTGATVGPRPKRGAKSTTDAPQPSAWRSRIVGAGEEAPDQLVANPRNWTIHPKGQQDALASVLDEVGWVQQVLVNQRSGLVVDGHLRVELALSRGEPAVPVLYVDLTPEEEALVLASLDPLAGMAVTDPEKLRELLAGITVSQSDLLATLRGLAPEPKEGLTDPDDVPEPADEPYVKAGDLWLLGDHRLLCGDATNAEDVARLLDGATPRLLDTDPPYGVQLDPTWRDNLYNDRLSASGASANINAAKPYMQKPGHHFPVGEPGPDGKRSQGRSIPASNGYQRTEGHKNTTVSGDTIVDWSHAYALVPSLEVAYVWHAGVHAPAVADGLASLGFEMRSQIIWVKTQFAMSRGDYHWQHEPCWYAVKSCATARWLGTHDLSTTWELASPKMIMGGSQEEKLDHPAQKPVECMARPLRHHEGDVYEPFVGSGTTLIAAEMEGRRCYAMEVEPRFVQQTIERWQRFTGREATRG